MPTPRSTLAEDVGAVVDLVLLPSEQTVSIDDTFDITIQAQCNGQDVTGISAFVDFDPDYLECQSITGGTTLPLELWNTYDNVAGTADYSAGTTTQPWPCDTFTVATISFRALDTISSTALTFHTTDSRTTDADFGGESKLSDLTGAAVAISNTPNNEGEDLSPGLEPGTTNVSQIITDKGVFIEATIAQTENGLCKIMIDKGTVALTRDNKPLSAISMTQLEELPVPPKYAHIIGPTYNLGPDGATFRPSVTLIITYGFSNIPEGITEVDLVLAWFDIDAGGWVELISTTDTSTKTIMASVEHFTPFAIVGYEAVVEPGAFKVSSLNIFPAEVHIGETVTISLVVANDGSEAGSYKIILKINGVPESTRHVTVNAGSSSEVSFTISKDIAGSYSVDVNGLIGSFRVSGEAAPSPVSQDKPFKWLVLWCVIGGLVIVVLFILLVRRRKY